MPCRLGAGVGLVALAVSACGTETLASKVAPKPPTYAEASGADTSCNASDKYASPLVVDSRPEQRADLEVAMKHGVAVVAYDCKHLRVLGNCRLDGEYEFMGVNPKQQLIRLESSEEVGLNLPLGGLGAAKVGAGLRAGATLDVALSMVGKKMSTQTWASRSSLVGECSGATHFVSGATVGAFAVATGSHAKLTTALEIFGLGAEAESSEQKSVLNRDGVLEACKDADPASNHPPGKCSSLVRLDLTAIDIAPPDPDVPAFARSTCPGGSVLSGGKCTEKNDEVPHQCKIGELGDCEKQCGKDDAASCAILGDMLSRGKWSQRDDAKAAVYFEKSCTLGDEHGCSGLGVAYLDGHGVDKDEARGVELLRKACGNGSAKGCTSLGYAYTYGKGVPKDEARAAAWFDQACRGGEQRACANLGVLLLDGKGVPKDVARAVSLLKRACVGHDASGCYNLARLMAEGTGVPKDVPKAIALYMEACEGGEGFSCNNLGTHYVKGVGVPKDFARAARLFERACNIDPTACANLAALVAAGKGAKKDPTRAAALYKRACDAGDDFSCKKLAGKEP